MVPSSIRMRSATCATRLGLLLAALLLASLTGGAAAADNTSAGNPCASTPAPAPAEDDIPLYISLPIILLLVMMSGLFSGLTLGLMGLDLIGLQTVENGDNPDAAKCAAKIKPVRQNGNLLLCTLLLGNVAVNSALSILTAGIASGTIGFLVSTALIVVFGEILPQAACSKYALQVGARTVWIVKILIAIMFVLTYPMSLMLDKLLGKDLGQIYSTSELMEMVKLQIERGCHDEEAGQMAKQVVEGALNFRNKSVAEVMTPLEDAYMLSSDTKLGYDTVRDIFERGFSRVPVYGKDHHDYKGLLHTKDLILADPEDEMRLGDFINIFDRQALSFKEDSSLVNALSFFKKGKAHLALIRSMNLDDPTNPKVELKGLLSLEDVIEEILQDEIVDEADVFVDVDRQLKVEDGRERRKYNLGIFNPVWNRERNEQLSHEEIRAIAAHLSREFFESKSDLALSSPALEWLVSVSELQSWTRVAPLSAEPSSKDYLYKVGHKSSSCTLVLQGRAKLVVGKDEFRTEAGAFSLLAKDALRQANFSPDFNASLGTTNGRFLFISRENFEKARRFVQSDRQLESRRGRPRGRSDDTSSTNQTYPSRAEVSGSPRSPLRGEKEAEEKRRERDRERGRPVTYL